jgi:hypothetical protein
MAPMTANEWAALSENAKQIVKRKYPEEFTKVAAALAQ